MTLHILGSLSKRPTIRSPNARLILSINSGWLPVSCGGHRPPAIRQEEPHGEHHHYRL
jgi:hypothetical protein